MINDILGMGRSSILEGFIGGAVDPEIAAITLESVEEIPDYADPASYAIQLAYANEANLQQLDMAILAEEYMYLRDTGTEMVWEAGGLLSVVKRFKEWVKKLWEKITSFFKSLFSKVAAQTTSVKKMLETYKEAGKSNKSVEVTTIAPSSVTIDSVATAATEMCEAIRSRVDLCAQRMVREKAKKIADENKRTKEVEDNIKQAAQILVGSDDFTQSTVCKKLGLETTKEKTSMTGKAAYDSLKAYISADSSYRAIYAVNKGSVDGMIKAAKIMEDATQTISTSSGYSDKETKKAGNESKLIHDRVTEMTKYGSWMTLMNGAAVSCINATLNRDKYVLAHIKGGRAGSTNEGAIATEDAFAMMF